MAYKVCGYSAGAALPELWDIRILNGSCAAPHLLRAQQDCGSNWDGELDALCRLLLGVGVKFRDVLVEEGIPEADADEAVKKVQTKLAASVLHAAMPIQDAIELATYMVRTTIGFMRFNFGAETVGGPIEVAVITKHEGFKWVNRKLFFGQGTKSVKSLVKAPLEMKEETSPDWDPWQSFSTCYRFVLRSLCLRVMHRVQPQRPLGRRDSYALPSYTNATPSGSCKARYFSF